MKWNVIAFLGFCLFGIGAYDYQLHISMGLQNQHVMLIIAAVILVLISVLKPNSMKFGDIIEMQDLVKKTETAVAEADKSSKLAMEINAMSVWNNGRLGGIGDDKKQEALATEILKTIYGDKADAVRNFLQHSGLFQTPPNELKDVPKSMLTEKDIPEIYKLNLGLQK